MTDKLGIYNGALRVLGERKLSGLTENREPRRLLDDVWDDDGVKACLEQGQWYFAMRTVMIDHDPAVSPAFGYAYGFSKSDDWVLTSAFCSDEYFNSPITRYTDENGYWYADETPVYVKYVSNDAAYGQNFGIWPESFTKFVQAWFASEIVNKLPGDDNRVKRTYAILKERKDEARSRAAMALPTSFPARGTWVRFRQGNAFSRDRSGNSGPLIG